jgi:Ca-activated chloride channel homolog
MIKQGLGILIIFMASSLSAQNAKKLLREGNNAYLGKQDYKKAEEMYKRALAADNKYGKASYNLGAAYYKQGKFDESAAQFEGVKSFTNNKDTVAKGLHNQGTAYLKAKKYDDAVKTLKSALKNNPNDEDTRYNLAYAMYQKKKEDQKKQNQKQNQNQEQKQVQKEQKQEQKPQTQISEKEAERMLNALKQEEKKLQKSKRKKEEKNSEKFSGKDW